RSKRADRESATMTLLNDVATSHTGTMWAARALNLRAQLEERAKTRVIDQQLNTSVPTALVTYRTLVETYPTSDVAEGALDKLSSIYDDLKRYELAAQSLE